MKVLSLDVSTKTGWAIHEDNKLIEYGLIRVELKDFNVNKEPNKSDLYPYNLMDTSIEMAEKIAELVIKCCPDEIVIENTTKGRNRHTQRLLEWLHWAVIFKLRLMDRKFHYLDPSEWRRILEIRMSKDDKKNNKLVNEGKKRGKITKKHLSVRSVNSLYDLKLKLKDNDIADAICLGRAFCEQDE